MDTNQTRVIELLREVQLIAFKEIERLNLRIAELESENRLQNEHRVAKLTAINPPAIKPKQAEMLNDHQVAEYLNISVVTLRRWRLFRKGPKFLKIGSAVRYRRVDLERWLDSCPGQR